MIILLSYLGCQRERDEADFSGCRKGIKAPDAKLIADTNAPCLMDMSRYIGQKG